MRISGIASGIDTETMINKLMEAERIPLNKFKQQKQTLEWQRDAFRDVNTALLSFKEKINSMKYTANYRARTLVSSDDSKVSANVSSGAVLSTYSITNVEQLAKAATKVSEPVKSEHKEKFAESKTKLTDVLGELNEGNSKFTITTHTSNGVKSKEFEITENDTLSSVIDKVNSSDLGVTMFYDSQTGKTSISRNETGQFNDGTEQSEFPYSENQDKDDIQVSGKLMETLNLTNATENQGQNAIFTINGLETERSSNTFTMNGVTFTLKETFTNDAAPVTFSVGNDTDKVMDNIKEFVKEYNELIEMINGKLNEPVNRSYQPLTEEEKEALSEKQIEKWESLAKSGLLKRDPTLMNVLSSMRLDFSSPVSSDGAYNMLSSIGITTTADYLSGGKLEINEDKLREALEADPDAVERLFRGTDEEGGKGIIHKLSDTVDTAVNQIRDKAGRATSTNQQFSIGKAILNIDKSIERFENKLELVESRYWKQFTAMERAMQRANDQSAQLMSQLMG